MIHRDIKPENILLD